jgi:hypothetical protein
MSTLDELFDPKRLGGLWSPGGDEGKAAASKKGESAKPEPVEAIVVFERLVLSIKRDLGPRAETLEPRLERARRLLREQYGIPEPLPPISAEAAAAAATAAAEAEAFARAKGKTTTDDTTEAEKKPAPPARKPLEGKALAKKREELGEVLDQIEDLYEALAVGARR